MGRFLLFSFLFCAILSGCDHPKKRMVKPFLIVDKDWVRSGKSVYYYQDANGTLESFTDGENVYKVEMTDRQREILEYLQNNENNQELYDAYTRIVNREYIDKLLK